MLVLAGSAVVCLVLAAIALRPTKKDGQPIVQMPSFAKPEESRPVAAPVSFSFSEQKNAEDLARLNKIFLAKREEKAQAELIKEVNEFFGAK